MICFESFASSLHILQYRVYIIMDVLYIRSDLIKQKKSNWIITNPLDKNNVHCWILLLLDDSNSFWNIKHNKSLTAQSNDKTSTCNINKLLLTIRHNITADNHTYNIYYVAETDKENDILQIQPLCTYVRVRVYIYYTQHVYIIQHIQ